MATRRFRQRIPFTLSTRSVLSVSSHLKWLKYLTSDSFYNDYRREFQSTTATNNIQALARVQIEALIYAKYNPKVYQRTFNLLNSVKVSADSENSNANLVLFSDPAVAPAKGENLPNHSYLEFFDPRSEYRSFLLNVLDPEDAIRPFFDALEQLMLAETEINAKRAYEALLNASKPAL